MSFNNNLFDDYTVALDSGLPAGLSFNSSTLIISGCATAE
jgi:hypothetical protein